MASLKFLLLLIISASIVHADNYHEKISRMKSKSHDDSIKPEINPLELYNEYWDDKAQKLLDEQLKFQENTKKAKNVILFIADGLSITTTAATRMYLGGEEVPLSYEAFSHYGLARTYCVDHQISSSSCAANALMHGIKNNRRGVGVNANVLSSQCAFNEADRTYSIAKWAQDAGKATGIVTNTEVTHATPASAYAHVSERDWYNNNAIPQTCRDDPNNSNIDIAYQLVYNEEAIPFKVILGGGRRQFINETEVDEENQPGRRTDGKNLINEWLEERNKIGKAEYVTHKQQLDELNLDNTDYLLGLFESDHCMYRLDVVENNLQKQEPQLSDMTRTAIKMLQKEENGFFLMVEGGRIGKKFFKPFKIGIKKFKILDMAHHDNKPRKALDETAEFARAIEVARTMTNDEDTLIVVTSDHSHTFTYSGYPWRHRDIFGLVEPSRGNDSLPYETLSYANGPGYSKTYQGTDRADLRSEDFKDTNRLHAAGVPLASGTHGGDDVAIYANGPWASLFQGSYEQNVVALAMAYAAQIGPYKPEEITTNIPITTPNTGSFIYLYPVLLILSAVSFMML